MARKTHEMEFMLQAQLGSSYAKTFQSAQKQIVALQEEITELSRTQSDISAYQKQQEAVDQTRKKLENLEEQYANIQREIQETEGFSSSLQNRLLAKQMQIDKTSSSLRQETQRLDEMGAALQEAGVDTNNLTSSSSRLAAQMDDLRQEQDQAADSAQEFGETGVNAFTTLGNALMGAGIIEGVRQVAEYFVEASKASMSFESAMTGVAKTTDLTDEEFAAMSEAIADMSTTMPTTAEELAGIMEAAGQLGIQKDALVDFTETMAMLGVSTNMSADEAATALARFANITGTSADNYSRLGAVIVGLGNSFATTESEITEMATRLASAGTLAGLTEAEIMALAASMSSVGIEAEAGGTAMTQTLSAIEEAVVNGGDKLEQFAEIAGMSSQEFSTAWQTNAMSALQAFIVGISELEGQGESAVLVLDELGLSGVRQSNMLKSLALAADQMTGAVEQANQEWEDNTALVNEASRFYDTTENKLKMMYNAYQRVTVAIGNAYNPALKKAAEFGTDALNGLAEFIDENPALVNAIGAAAGTLGIGVVALTAYTVATQVATAASAAFTAASGVALGPVMAVVGGVAALAGVIAAVATSIEDDGVPSVGELTEAAQASSAAMEEASASYYDSMAQVQASANMADGYISKLEELEATGLRTEEQQEEYHNTLMLLSEAIPELAGQIDLQTDSIAGGTDALRANTAAWKENAEEQAKAEYLKSVQEQYNDVMKEAANNSLEYTRASQQLEAAEQKKAQATQRMNELYDEAAAQAQKLQDEQGLMVDTTSFLTEEYWQLYNSMNSTNQEIETARATAETYREAMDADKESVAAMTETIEMAGEAFDNLTGSMGENGETSEQLAAQTQQINDLLGSATSQLDVLIQAYTEAYDSALSSIQGQFGLWETAAAVVPTSIYTINDAIQSQITYWQSYNDNLAYLSESYAQFPGLQEMVASFADGSSESISMVQGITDALRSGNDEDVMAMVTNWQNLQAEEEATAEGMAELKTGALAEMDQLVAGVEQDIANMNLSAEASASGRATMQGYISGLDSLSGVLDSKLAAINSKVQSALSAASSIPSGGGSTKGYATGTESAERGFALVGEEGPELVFFNGGEQVLTARETAELRDSGFEAVAFAPQLMAAMGAVESAVGAVPASSGGGNTTVQITFEIGGDVTSEAVDRLEDYGDDFAQRVLEVVESAQEDARRGSYR